MLMKWYHSLFSICLLACCLSIGCTPVSSLLGKVVSLIPEKPKPYEDLPFLRVSYQQTREYCETDSTKTVLNKHLNINSSGYVAIDPATWDSYRYPSFYFKYDSLYVDMRCIDWVCRRLGIDSWRLPTTDGDGSPRIEFVADGRYFKNNHSYKNDVCSYTFIKKCDETTAFSIVLEKEEKNDAFIDLHHFRIDFTERLVYYSSKNVLGYKEKYIQ